MELMDSSLHCMVFQGFHEIMEYLEVQGRIIFCISEFHENAFITLINPSINVQR